MKAFKRTVSVLLSLVLVLGMLTIGISVSAAETNTVTVTSNLGDNYKINYNSNSQTVTVVYNLQSKYRVVNVQGIITFDSKVLRFKSYDAPILTTAGLVVNRQKATQGRLPFNASSAQGLDYSKKDAVITVVFDIIGSGNTTVNLQYDVITANSASTSGTTSDTDVELVNFSYINPDKTLYSTDAEPSVYPPAVSITDFLVNFAANMEGKIGVNFYYQIPDAYKGKTIKVVTSTDFLGEQEDILDSAHLASNGQYRVSYFVYSYMMADTITIKIYADDVYLCSFNYSVRNYANSMKNSSNVKMKNLALSMMNYGAASQIYFNHNTDNLANAGFDYPLEPVTADMIKSTYKFNPSELSAMGLTFANYTPEFASDTAIRLYMSGDVSSVTAKVKGETVEPQVSGNYKIYSIKNIFSYDIDTPQSITFTKGSLSSTIEWSVLDVCKSILSGAANSNEYKNLAMAVYRYNEAANAYFGK